MKFYIIATAPTVHQLDSLTAFGMPYKPNKDGSFSVKQEFDSEEEAIEYLTERAKQHLAQYSFSSDMDFAEMMSELENGCLTIDAVTAHIVEEG